MKKVKLKKVTYEIDSSFSLSSDCYECCNEYICKTVHILKNIELERPFKVKFNCKDYKKV